MASKVAAVMELLDRQWRAVVSAQLSESAFEVVAGVLP